jgi:hypothetical protein
MNTGPDGTGKARANQRLQLWKVDNDGLIGESMGHFDGAEYKRQIKEGVG